MPRPRDDVEGATPPGAGPASSDVRVSVITPTTGRLDVLRAKRRSLERQTLATEAFEWIVCMDGPRDLGASADAEDPLDPRAAPFRLVRVALDEARGPGAARNACLVHCRGDVVVLSDDDIVLPEDLLERHLAAQTEQRGVWIGAVEFRTPERCETWRPRRVGPENVNGANTSVPRDSLEAIGGFIELAVYGGEDVDVGLRLADHGHPFRVLPGPPVVHLGPNPTWGWDLDKPRRAGANAVRIAAGRPRVSLRLGVHPAVLVLKRLVLQGPLGRALRRVSGSRTRATMAYERAYLEGALAARRADRADASD